MLYNQKKIRAGAELVHSHRVSVGSRDYPTVTFQKNFMSSEDPNRSLRMCIGGT